MMVNITGSHFGMFHVFSQKIGIFYKDEGWCKTIFEKVYNHYSKLNLILSYRPQKTISLRDGSSIVFCPTNDNTRGGCYSKIIMQEGISDNIIEKIIRPQLKYQTREIIVVYNPEGEKKNDNDL